MSAEVQVVVVFRSVAVLHSHCLASLLSDRSAPVPQGKPVTPHLALLTWDTADALAVVVVVVEYFPLVVQPLVCHVSP